MTRRIWPGTPASSIPGQSKDVSLSLISLGSGQSPTIPKAFPTNSDMVLPLARIWIPQVIIKPEPEPLPPVNINQVYIEGFANQPLSSIYPIDPPKPCSIYFTYNPSDISSDDEWITAPDPAEIPYELNMDGQIITSGLLVSIHFTNKIPDFILFSASEPDDPFNPNPPKVELDEPDACQAGVEGRIAFEESVWNLYLDGYYYGFYFIYYSES